MVTRTDHRDYDHRDYDHRDYDHRTMINVTGCSYLVDAVDVGTDVETVSDVPCFPSVHSGQKTLDS